MGIDLNDVEVMIMDEADRLLELGFTDEVALNRCDQESFMKSSVSAL